MDLNFKDEKRLEELKKKLSEKDKIIDSSLFDLEPNGSANENNLIAEELENPQEIFSSESRTLTSPRVIGRIDLDLLNKRNHPRKRISQSIPDSRNSNRNLNYQIIEPTRAIGKLKFFDYRVNKFGIIIDVKNENNIQTGEVRLLESGLATERRIFDGETVSFTLNKNNRGFFATDVKSINELTLKNLGHFNQFIGVTELEKIIYNSVGSNYQLLDGQDRTIINEVLIKEKSPDSWNLLIKLESDEALIKNFIENVIDPLTDQEKISFLKKHSNIRLLQHILIGWESEDKHLLLSLVELVRINQFTDDNVSKGLITCLSINEWTFDELFKLFSIFKMKIIKELLLNSFSFRNYNSLDLLKNILPVNDLTDQIIKTLSSNFLMESCNISIQKLFQIFTDLKQYQIIKDSNKLLELLIDRNLEESELISLIQLLSANVNLITFRKVILKNIENISSWQLVELLELCKNKTKLAKVFLDEFYTKDTNSSFRDFYRLINYLKEKNNIELLWHFVDISYKSISITDPIDTFEISIISNHIDAQKLSFQNIRFNSEYELIEFTERIPSLIIPYEIEVSNKPLSDFIKLLKSTSNFELSLDCKSFLKNNKGIVQSLTIKFLIYQLYKKRLSKTKLIEILNSFKWTEISALLIKGFIEESNFTEKILLEKLNPIYKTHFEVLSNENFDKDTFLNNFKIRDILNNCDGRKYYNGRRWSGRGEIRWYFDGKVSITYTKEKMNCFCEGRPWKKEYVWNSGTNIQSKEQIEFYWCKSNYCASRNDSEKLDTPYYHWSLTEISSALNITIEKIALANLAGWANRMNQIIEHLFCRKCNSILRPIPYRPSTLGYYAVPLFHCINPSCTEKQTIRFTHCLNGKCESHRNSEPLDSRDCKNCRPSDPNHTGLLCNICGSSCPSCSGIDHKITVQQTW